MNGRVYYVGREAEVAAHARPLLDRLPLEIADCEAVRERAAPGDVAIFFSEHFDRFRTLCLDLRRRNVATLYAIDGILEWRNAWDNRPDELACPWTMRPCLSHVVAAIGPLQHRILASWGNENVVLIGLPRLDPWVESWQRARAHARSLPTSGGPGEVEIAMRKAGTHPRLLVTTAKCPGFTDEQLERTLHSLQAIKEHVESGGGMGEAKWDVAWRLTGGMAAQLGVETTATPENDLATDMSRCDAVISTSSTVILEGMLRRLPVALLDFHNTPIYVDTAFRIQSASQVPPVLEQLRQFPHDAPRRHWQDFLLQENLVADGRATERMAQLVEWMSVESARCAAESRTLEFNLDDIDRRISEKSRFEFPIYQQLRTTRIVSETSATDTDTGWDLAQWQAYTEQLERENQRLERWVGEAHQVFRNMHAHPVLGRLLRVHEWWSRWWSGEPGELAEPEDRVSK